MPDITMCADKQCPNRSTCYRFIAKPNEYQSYFVGSPREDGECGYYLPTETR